MKNMVKAAGIPTDKKLSNHSARKHLVQKLSEQNIPPNQIMQITGHRNLQSVNNYSHVSENQHKNISKLLSNNLSVTQNNSIHNQLVSSISVENNNSASSMSFQGALDTMFGGNIYGGNISIYINSKGDAFHSPPAKKRRTMVIYDSDSE